MKKFDLPMALDALFYTACAWLFCVGITRFYRLPPWLVFTLSTLLALAVGLVSLLLIGRGHRQRALSRAERERREALLLHLTLERPERVRALLARAYAADGKSASLTDDGVEADGVLLVPRFTVAPLSADDAAALLRMYRERPFVLLCNELSPEADALLRSFKKEVVRGDGVYALFVRTGLPERLICGERPKQKRLRIAFSKKNARPFFVSGALLLVMSLFTFFPLYYLIAGSVLLLVSVGVRIVGFA